MFKLKPTHLLTHFPLNIFMLYDIIHLCAITISTNEFDAFYIVVTGMAETLCSKSNIKNLLE